MVLSGDKISVTVKESENENENESESCDYVSSSVGTEQVTGKQYAPESEAQQQTQLADALSANDGCGEEDDVTEDYIKSPVNDEFSVGDLEITNVRTVKEEPLPEPNDDESNEVGKSFDHEALGNRVKLSPAASENMPQKDDENLRHLLQSFDLEILFTTLKLSSITFRSLPYLEKEDINSAIHHIGYRAEFREKLFAWRAQQQPIKSELQVQTSNDRQEMVSSSEVVQKFAQIAAAEEMMPPLDIELGTKSIATTADFRGVREEFNLHSFDACSPLVQGEGTESRPHTHTLPAPPKGYGYLPKGLLNMKCRKLNLQLLLRQCHPGRTLMLLYDKNGCLEAMHRAELVRIIIDDLVQRGERLTQKDYNSLVHDIVTVFPNEKIAADYYYIDRNKCSPVGRLYQCYCSENAKRRKSLKQAAKKSHTHHRESGGNGDGGVRMEKGKEYMHQAVPTTRGEDESDSSNSCDTQKKEEDAVALKEIIQSGQYNWEEMCSRWLQTLSLRQSELKEAGLGDFLNNWPIYRDPKAVELFNIDFKRSYPGRENLLFAKWSEFSEQMMPVFEKRVTANFIRKWIRHARRHEATKDENDFALAIGLIGLLPTVKNFKDRNGKLKTRSTVKDNMDSFAMTLTTLDSFEKQHRAYEQKFGETNRTEHPFLVIISTTDCNISRVYVIVGPHHYCMKSFLHALDLCYKVYHTCGLRYPTMCENVWTFIQRYFYNMSVPWESRNPNLSTFINALTAMN